MGMWHSCVVAYPVLFHLRQHYRVALFISLYPCPLKGFHAWYWKYPWPVLLNQCPWKMLRGNIGMPLFNLYSCVSPLHWQGVFVWLCHVTVGCYTVLQFQRLPFLFPYYGHTLSYIGVTTNGMILLLTASFSYPCTFCPTCWWTVQRHPLMCNVTRSVTYVRTSGYRPVQNERWFTVEWCICVHDEGRTCWGACLSKNNQQSFYVLPERVSRCL